MLCNAPGMGFGVQTHRLGRFLQRYRRNASARPQPSRITNNNHVRSFEQGPVVIWWAKRCGREEKIRQMWNPQQANIIRQRLKINGNCHTVLSCGDVSKDKFLLKSAVKTYIYLETILCRTSDITPLHIWQILQMAIRNDYLWSLTIWEWLNWW